VQIVRTFLEPIKASLFSAAAALPVSLVVIAAPVRAAVAADSFKKDLLATFGLSVTLRPPGTEPPFAGFLILLIAIF
jgi:hypothetical protein